jgi:hypothetical protein
MSDPIPFPHDSRSANKTARAGVITVNDIIYEDSYGIMTRGTVNEPVSHTSSVYSIDEDSGSLIERANTLQSLDTQNNASMHVNLMSTVQQISTMNPVLDMTANKTIIKTLGNNANFDVNGLYWNDQISALYIGGKDFRIQYVPATATTTPTLQIQSLQEDGSYVQKFSITK